MKHIVSLFLAAVMAAVFLAGCTSAGVSPPKSNEASRKLKVVATIFPPYDFVRQIAGNAVELTMLLPPGAESHSYEPSPQDVVAIQNADVFIYAGGASDNWLEGVLDSLDTSGLAVLSMMDMVEVAQEEIVEGMQHEHEDEAEQELDEHVWTSPKNAMKIVDIIADKLRELDAENADLYTSRTEDYQKELAGLDAELAKVVAESARKTVVFGDRFPFGYLARDYGLAYYAAFPGCSSAAEPSAATVAFLIDKVRAESIPVVFAIEMSSGKMADIICADTGAKRLELHSAHNLTKQQLASGESYLSLMRRNIDVLREALN